jgi:hypothetical protein
MIFLLLFVSMVVVGKFESSLGGGATNQEKKKMMTAM